MLNLDNLIVEFDQGLAHVVQQGAEHTPVPGCQPAGGGVERGGEKTLGCADAVNHSGEICAQALYQGQALTARDPVVQEKLQQAAQEETEHLAWTSRRVHELAGI